jgi:hypothetical protein
MVLPARRNPPMIQAACRPAICRRIEELPAAQADCRNTVGNADLAAAT